MMKPPNIFVYSYLYPSTSKNSSKHLSIEQVSSIVDQSLPVNSFTVTPLSDERLLRTTPQTFFDYTQLLILYGHPSASPVTADPALESKLADYVKRGGRVLCFGPPPSSLNTQLPQLQPFLPFCELTLSVELPESVSEKLGCLSLQFSIIGNSLFQARSANTSGSDESSVTSLYKFMYYLHKEDAFPDTFRSATILSVPTRYIAISMVYHLGHDFL